MSAFSLIAVSRISSAGRHHPEVDHAVVVAAEHDADDVLADVVDVALDGGGDQGALGAVGDRETGVGLLLLHERLQVGDRLLHGARRLHHLRQEHLAAAEQVADDLHAVHQRALDHLERAVVGLAGLLGVVLDVVDDAVHQRVREAILHRGLPPGEVVLALEPSALDRLGEDHHAFGGVRAPVEDDVLDVLEHVLGDVRVDLELPRVHDGHVQARGDRVVQERGVDRAAHGLVPAEGEAQVGDAAAHVDARTAALDLTGGFDERLGVVVVLLEPGGDRQDVGVDDDVAGVEAGFGGEQADRALGDLDLALDRAGLALLVEAHHDHGRAVVTDLPGLGEEVLLALLQADRVDDALALDALQPGLEGVPAGAVDHDRHAGDLGLGGDQVEEPGHGLLGVEEVGVHVDVEHVGAAAHLVERHVDGGLEVTRFDQAAGTSRCR